MTRIFKAIGWTLLSLFLLLVLALTWILASNAGSRWALAQVPGLQVEQFDGRLGGRWQAQRLLWVQGDSRVEVSAPRFAWSPSCLLRLTLCLEEVAAEGIDLDFPPGVDEQDSGEPFSLPDIKLPLSVQVGRIDLGPLRLNRTEQMRSLLLRADWRAAGLDIQTLQLRRQDLSLDLHGRLQPSGQWPLTVQGEASLNLLEGQPWTLKIAIAGEVREQVAIDIDSRGYLNGRLNAQVQPLDEQLPATLKLTAEGFKASPELPETLRLQALELTARGNLEEGYQLLGTSRFPAQGDPVRLALEGLVRTTGARIDTLALDAGKDRWVRLNGSLDWQSALQADASLGWKDFPWRSLYPEIEEPPVALRQLTAQVHYDDGAYLGHFAADLNGPAGDFSLQSPVSGNLEAVHLPQLQLRAGQGRATGSLGIGFADGIDWTTDLALSELDPSYWLEELPGKLGGSLKSQGALRNGQLQADASLDVQGRLRDQPAKLQLQTSGREQRWELASLDVRLGDNRIHGQGRWAEALDGQLRLNLAQLAQLWPGLRGQLNGRVDLGGTPEAIQGTLSLDGREMAFEDNRLRQLIVAASLAAGARGRLDLTAAGLRSGDTDLGTLEVKAEGTARQHQANLHLQGAALELALALDGALQKGDWRGRLLRVNLDGADQHWVLQRPAAIERLASGRINLGAHCWVSGPASLCAPDQRLLPDTQLRYRLRDFPLDSLATYLPDDFAWRGELSADIQLDLPSAGPSGQVRIDAGPGALRLREGAVWHDFPYQTLLLDSRLAPQLIDTHLSFIGGNLGELDLRVRLDPRKEDKPLDGEFRLTGLQLAVARPFVQQVDRLEGELNGSGRLSGTLLQPMVNGQLALNGAEISGSQLPTSFEDLRLALFIQGESLRLEGGWRSGEQGAGRLLGQADWRAEPRVNLELSGEHLPMVVEPYAELEVAPDLRLQLTGEQVTVTGKVRVPRGDITVRELPPSTVRVSDDVVIVGHEAEKPASQLDIDMDIDVEVGEEQLRFSGFGLTAELGGYLHIGDNLDARGELVLNKGRYRAYGQRLSIRRARLLFTGPLSQPFLDIEAVRRIEADNVVAGLRISGSAEQPRTEVFSEPAMSQEQALAYLVLGRSLGADTGDSNLLAQAALGLGLAGSASITGGLAQRLGIEDFQLDTEGSGDSTSVVASGRLTDRLSLRYGVGVFEPANTIALRYRLSKRVFLEAASGLASSLDLFYRRDF